MHFSLDLSQLEDHVNSARARSQPTLRLRNIFLRNRANKAVEDHPSKNLPHNGQQGDVMIVPKVCFVVFVFLRG